MNKIYTICILVFFFSGCDRVLFAPEPENSPQVNFDLLWDSFDRHYSYFEIKAVDWDSIYTVYRPQVDDNTTPAELYAVFEQILLVLEDGHVNLSSSVGKISYNYYDDAPDNHPTAIWKYVVLKRANETIKFGQVKDAEIGYIHIESFSGPLSDFEVIDGILEELGSFPSIIIDIRDNGGGSDFNGFHIASRFFDKSRVTRRVRFRNGPKHTDFTDWVDFVVGPEGPFQFKGDVVILTNRRVFSAAEGFALGMKELPNVTIVGDTTAGGSGNPLYRELPNGWLYRLSNWQLQSASGLLIEGVGIKPDVPVWISQQDENTQTDRILETAISLLDGSN